jgi:hypothetical protein
MATVSDLTITPVSGLPYIDALLDKGPDWNFLPVPPGAQRPGNNTILYTFSVASGNEKDQTGQEGFTLAQQAATRTAFDYISTLTGIQFKETAIGTDAQIHLCNINIPDYNTTGLCSWHSSYSYNGALFYDVDAYVYLDNLEWRASNFNLTPGGRGYETLLHELGHALGLKHPFEAEPENMTTLNASVDNTGNTVMSYTHAGSAHSTYGQYDIAALKWLYGMDGLGGALGINSNDNARYIAGTSGADTLTGTAANDTLEGDGGNDMIDGGSGIDTAVFRGVRSNYTMTALANGDLMVAGKDGIDGVDTLHSVELLQFDSMSGTSADVVPAGADLTAPEKPTLVVTKNVNGYTTGNTPLFTGKAEVGSIVKIFTDGNKQVGTATADQYGLYTGKLDIFADGLNYKVYATATDAAGNVSVVSNTESFKVDSVAPVSPTFVPVNVKTDSNQVNLSGTAEAGTRIELVRAGDLQTIAHTTVGADGIWQLATSPLPNGSYSVSVISLDQADNGSNAATRPTWTINSSANTTGTAGADLLKPGAGNNAIDGGAGIDTVVYAGSRANFTVTQEDWGFGITDNKGSSGHDSLINVERIQFDDGYLAIDVDGAAGQLFRLYSAAFGRPSDDVGMGYWLSVMEAGKTLKQVSREFMVGDGHGQPEFDKAYGVNLTDETFVRKLYNNVLGRDPDADGFNFWMNALKGDTVTDHTTLRAQIMIDFSDSVENIAKVVGTLEHGVAYVPHT